jgi:hypothetical protein
MRNSNEQNIKQIISNLFEGTKVESKLLETELVIKWPSLVGELIAKQTTKMYVHNGKLYLHILSAPLRNELKFSRSRIVEIINEFAKTDWITDVIILGDN